jgi:hypothetical protein
MRLAPKLLSFLCDGIPIVVFFLVPWPWYWALLLAFGVWVVTTIIQKAISRMMGWPYP